MTVRNLLLLVCLPSILTGLHLWVEMTCGIGPSVQRWTEEEIQAMKEGYFSTFVIVPSSACLPACLPACRSSIGLLSYPVCLLKIMYFQHQMLITKLNIS